VWAVTVQREEKHGSAPRKRVNVPSVPTFLSLHFSQFDFLTASCSHISDSYLQVARKFAERRYKERHLWHNRGHFDVDQRVVGGGISKKLDPS